jgi:hypothetical protein
MGIMGISFSSFFTFFACAFLRGGHFSSMKVTSFIFSEDMARSGARQEAGNLMVSEGERNGDEFRKVETQPRAATDSGCVNSRIGGTDGI